MYFSSPRWFSQLISTFSGCLFLVEQVCIILVPWTWSMQCRIVLQFTERQRLFCRIAARWQIKKVVLFYFIYCFIGINLFILLDVKKRIFYLCKCIFFYTFWYLLDKTEILYWKYFLCSSIFLNVFVRAKKGVCIWLYVCINILKCDYQEIQHKSHKCVVTPNF